MKKFLDYEIQDNKKLPYYSLMFGIHMNQLEVVVQSLKAGVKIEKIKVNFQPVKEWEGKGYAKRLVSLLEYAEINCSSEIYEFLFSKSKLDDARIMAFLIKEVTDKSKTDIQIIKKMSSLVNKKNVNLLVKIFEFEKPFEYDEHCGSTPRTSNVSALHMACFFHRAELVDWLLKLGADPNLWTRGDRGRYAYDLDNETPITLLSKKMENKGNQDKDVQIILSLLEHGANFSLRQNGLTAVSGWKAILSKLKKENKLIVLKHSLPTNLRDIVLVQDSCAKIYGTVVFPATEKKLDRQTKMFSKYPVLKDISNHEEKVIYIDMEAVQLVEPIFKSKTLKRGLQNVYGFSSPRFINWFKEEILSVDKEVIQVHKRLIDYSLFLKNIFLVNNNSSDFLLFLEKGWGQRVSEAMNDRYSRNEEKLMPFLKNNFSEEQIKELIKSSEMKVEEKYQMSYSIIGDLCSMLSKQFETRLLTALKLIPFEQKDTFNKIHDFFVKEISVINIEKENLNQEEYFPELKKVEEITLQEDYKLVVAKHNHDLIKWGKLQGHCIGSAGYDRKARRGEIVLLGLIQRDEPKFSLEISKDGKILQVQGKSSSVPPVQVMKKVIEELQKISIVNQKEELKNWVE